MMIIARVTEINKQCLLDGKSDKFGSNGKRKSDKKHKDTLTQHICRASRASGSRLA